MSYSISQNEKLVFAMKERNKDREKHCTYNTTSYGCLACTLIQFESLLKDSNLIPSAAFNSSLVK